MTRCPASNILADDAWTPGAPWGCPHCAASTTTYSDFCNVRISEHDEPPEFDDEYPDPEHGHAVSEFWAIQGAGR